MIKGNVHFIGTLPDGSNPITLMEVPVNSRVGQTVYVKDYITPEVLGDNIISEDGKSILHKEDGKFVKYLFNNPPLKNINDVTATFSDESSEDEVYFTKVSD